MRCDDLLIKQYMYVLLMLYIVVAPRLLALIPVSVTSLTSCNLAEARGFTSLHKRDMIY